MKTRNYFMKRPCTAGFLGTLTFRSFVIGLLMVFGMHTAIQAQETQYTRPSWWFGAAAGANVNFYRGSTHQLTADFAPPVTFHDGMGAGLYFAPLVEFYRPDSQLGVMLQAGYDSRRGSFKQVHTPCNCPADLTTNLTYFTVEPSVRFAPFRSGFYLYAGPRFAFNIAKAFTYEQGVNPDYPDQIVVPDVEGDFSEINKMLYSMQIAAGYDIQLSSQYNHTQAVLSPFISFQPYFGQDPRAIETWNITTLRIGAALKFGNGEAIPVAVTTDKVVPVKEPDVKFTVYSPENIPSERRVRETFPVRNYVFFDEGSTEISDRYVMLRKGQVADFKEDQLEVFKPKRLSGRSDRQMIVYYNILNIVGDRMGKDPQANLTLLGSSAEGVADGLAMAESVKKYLVDIFGINASRIKTEGNLKPNVPSEQPGGTKELELLREEDRRVTIWSESPAMMMQFQSGPGAPIYPVEFVVVQEAPIDSYVTFTAAGAKKAFTSWSLELRDEKGVLQNFGPYTEEKVSIPGKYILGTKPKGNYKVTMVGKTKSGQVVRREADANIVLWKPSDREEGMRYSIVFEFAKSDATASYEKYLAEVVTPKIPKNSTVIIHGHTDIIGSDNNNIDLSWARATEVKGIIAGALTKAGRQDVKFETYGFGEDEVLAPFSNATPEERFYNRTVIIDIIPAR
jgi:outer membrane protein OmpA-like peptidoglycan-associated protein